MRPILFEIPIPFANIAIPISSYGMMLALSFLVGVSLAARDAERQGIDPNDYFTAAIYGMIFAILGARIFYIIQNWSDYASRPLQVFALWRGGLVFYGGFFGGTIGVGLYVYFKGIHVWKFLDATTPSIALGLFFTRIGCFLNGCCYGKPTDLPWGVRFQKGSNVYYDEIEKGLITGSNASSLSLHPVQLYESLEGLVLFLIFFFFLGKRKKFDGQTFWTFPLIYSVLRFANELLRGDDIRGYIWSPYITTSQFFSLLLFPLSIGVLIYMKRRKPIASEEQ